MISIAEEKSNKKPIEEKEEGVKTASEEFIEELNGAEREIFLELKDTLMNKCELLEFEAVNEDNLEDYASLITYIKNEVVVIKDDGVLINLRRTIENTKREVITKSVTILFERNLAREKTFTRGIKFGKKDIESQKEFTRALLTASFKNVDSSGVSKMLSVENTRGIHDKDYALLLTCYNFFRN